MSDFKNWIRNSNDIAIDLNPATNITNRTDQSEKFISFIHTGKENSQTNILVQEQKIFSIYKYDNTGVKDRNTWNTKRTLWWWTVEHEMIMGFLSLICSGRHRIGQSSPTSQLHKSCIIKCVVLNYLTGMNYEYMKHCIRLNAL